MNDSIPKRSSNKVLKIVLLISLAIVLLVSIVLINILHNSSTCKFTGFIKEC
jgi:hypothetical protein